MQRLQHGRESKQHFATGRSLSFASAPDSPDTGHVGGVRCHAYEDVDWPDRMWRARNIRARCNGGQLTDASCNDGKIERFRVIAVWESSPVTTDDRFGVPYKLPALVLRYTQARPVPVRFRLPSWETALAGVSGESTRFLSDPGITAPSTQQQFAAYGDRLVSREAVIDTCESIDLADDEAVLAAFVLVMAWGSGTSNSRSLRNTRKALQDTKAAAAALRDSAIALRAIHHFDDPALADAHQGFYLPGVREAFFTKWFAFAGFVREREWQPLILDSRVRATLHKTLNVWLNHMSDSHNDPARYIAYLDAIHRWAAKLPQPMTSTRLEWIMFRHNGATV
ncbi:hypothetical protein [Mycolicibacterium peregrinum]|uniref:8-oxoguanine DNA glycosylase OGG fold protein n=1 Tax=Mycolicibacterium peregrinum TaxID=43304 RepID=UPI003AAD2ACA